MVHVEHLLSNASSALGSRLQPLDPDTSHHYPRSDECFPRKLDCSNNVWSLADLLAAMSQGSWNMRHTSTRSGSCDWRRHAFDAQTRRFGA